MTISYRIPTRVGLARAREGGTEMNSSYETEAVRGEGCASSPG